MTRALSGAAGLLLLLLLAAPAAAQPVPATVTVRAITAEGPLSGARVSAGDVGAHTDATGEATLRLAAGAHTLRVEHIGWEPATTDLVLRPGADTLVVLRLERQAIEEEPIIVRSTRSERRIEDEPVRVEVIGREEIEEKLLMTPGDISMLLNETAGLRVQPTAAALGGASVRIQGLRGRYTQILSDGLPLYGGQAGALGPLQIPPMDLAQVEVIKGAASALYGASALGGVVNLLSRRPDGEGETELLLNQTSLDGTDAILWRSATLNEAWGYTLLASGHRQEVADVDEDGWADLPGFRRAAARPRLFWNGGRGGSAFFTVGAMVEDREGGSVGAGAAPGALRVRQEIETRRLDGGVVARFLRGGTRLLTLRGSGSVQGHGHRFDATEEEDVHATGFAEAALAGTSGPHAWVLGAALQFDDYRARDLEGYDYTHTVPGIFAQDEYDVSAALTVAASARLDHHSRHGSFLSPRLTALLRPAEGWTVRASGGGGYFAPTVWTDETEALGLARVVPPEDLEAERAAGLSLDLGRNAGPFEFNATLFGSRIRHAVQVRPAAGRPGMVELVNASAPIRTGGTELLARYHAEGIHVTATHVYLRATEPAPDGEGRREVPLTPRHTAGIVAAWEREERGRIGVELYYTGRQELEDNPHRERSVPYAIVGFLVEQHVGPVRLFLNAENLLDTRQTRYDPLVLSMRSPEGRWTTDVWAPLEGRAFNGGVRWTF